MAPLPISNLAIRQKPSGELSTEARAAIIAKFEAGISKAAIARDFNINRSTVYRTVEHYQKYGFVHSLPRSGRPSVLTPRQKRALYIFARQEPVIEYDELKKALGITASRSTIYRVLKARGLTNWRRRKRPKLTEEHAKLRLKFAKEFRHFNWRKVKFSDECSCERKKGANQVWVFRFPKEKWNKEMIEGLGTSKDIVQMVWGCIWWGGKAFSIMKRDPESPRNGYTAKSYVETLRRGLIPHYEPLDPFVQDNAPIHNAGYTREFLEQHGVYVIDWPPYSPDLNPIEHIWHWLKKRVYRDNPQFPGAGKGEQGKKDFRVALCQAWRQLPQRLIRQLIASMPRRLAAVRKARGWQTKY